MVSMVFQDGENEGIAEAYAKRLSGDCVLRLCAFMAHSRQGCFMKTKLNS